MSFVKCLLGLTEVLTVPGTAPFTLKKRLQTTATREGANREKLTVKKIINNEMFFFTVYIPYKP